MHEELKSELEELKHLKKNIMTAVNAEFAKGTEKVDTKEAGEAVDMIKDCAEAAAYCWMACYYEAVVKAMEESDDRYGYNPNRSRTTGRFMSGGRMGFTPNHPLMMDEMPYIQDYMDDPMMFREKMMGYSPDSQSNGSRGGSGRSSYGNSNTNMGYSPNEGDDRYGRSYRKWKDARRFYTETKSPEGAEAMHTAANEHIADTLVTLRDMWSGADTDLKKQMKADLTKLVSEMNV